MILEAYFVACMQKDTSACNVVTVPLNHEVTQFECDKQIQIYSLEYFQTHQHEYLAKWGCRRAGKDT